MDDTPGVDIVRATDSLRDKVSLSVVEEPVRRGDATDERNIDSPRVEGRKSFKRHYIPSDAHLQVAEDPCVAGIILGRPSFYSPSHGSRGIQLYLLIPMSPAFSVHKYR